MTFDEIIDALQALHRKMPDLSFGEIIQVATDRAKKRTNVCVADLPDKQLLAALRAYAGTEENARKDDMIRAARQKKRDLPEGEDIVLRDREQSAQVKRFFQQR